MIKFFLDFENEVAQIEGRINELGTHRKKKKKKGRYYALLNQSKGQ